MVKNENKKLFTKYLHNTVVKKIIGNIKISKCNCNRVSCNQIFLLKTKKKIKIYLQQNYPLRKSEWQRRYMKLKWLVHKKCKTKIKKKKK